MFAKIANGVAFIVLATPRAVTADHALHANLVEAQVLNDGGPQVLVTPVGRSGTELGCDYHCGRAGGRACGRGSRVQGGAGRC